MNPKLLYKKDRIILGVVLFCSILAGIFIKAKMSSGLYSDLITFLSILIGFQIAAFAILFTSPTVKALYETKDTENPYITLKHRLKNYYKFAFNLSLGSILLIFILQMFSFEIIWLKRIIILTIITSNIFVHYRTVNFLYKIFIKDK